MYAVREVSFRIEAGETYGLVGESGSGKTTTARLAVGMYRPDSGAITYRDRAGDLHHIGTSAGRDPARGASCAPGWRTCSRIPPAPSTRA